MADEPVEKQEPEKDDYDKLIAQLDEDEHRQLEERRKKQEEQREKWRDAKRRQAWKASKPPYPPELMNIIQSIEGYVASQSTPKVDIFKAIAETNNSSILYSVMLKAALRISWLQKRPELDEAIKKCSLRENPS